MLRFLNRIRKFDLQDLEWWQIVLGIAGAIVAVWVIGIILSILTQLIVPALAILGIYFAWRFLSRRAEDLPDDLSKSRQEREVEEAVATVQAAKNAEAGQATTVAVEEENPEENLIVKQVVNPETGFKEPDISRLVEREQQKLKEADKVTDDIMAQIEARRKRLNNSEGD